MVLGHDATTAKVMTRRLVTARTMDATVTVLHVPITGLAVKVMEGEGLVATGVVVGRVGRVVEVPLADAIPAVRLPFHTATLVVARILAAKGRPVVGPFVAIVIPVVVRVAERPTPAFRPEMDDGAGRHTAHKVLDPRPSTTLAVEAEMVVVH